MIFAAHYNDCRPLANLQKNLQIKLYKNLASNTPLYMYIFCGIYLDILDKKVQAARFVLPSIQMLIFHRHVSGTR